MPTFKNRFSLKSRYVYDIDIFIPYLSKNEKSALLILVKSCHTWNNLYHNNKNYFLFKLRFYGKTTCYSNKILESKKLY